MQYFRYAIYCMFIFNIACVAACDCDCTPFPSRGSKKWINFKRYHILFIAVSVPHPFYKLLHKNKKKKKTIRVCRNLIKCQIMIKVGLSPSKKNLFICFNDNPSKMMKNAFYFILKALCVLKIFKFLPWLFGHVEKTAW